MEEGLASALAQGEQEAGQADSIAQVVQLLKRGTHPEELLQLGIPEELIMAALEMINSEVAPVSGAEQRFIPEP